MPTARLAHLLLAAALLAACGREDDAARPAPAAPVSEAEPLSPSPASPPEALPDAPQQAGLPPPGSQRYVGRWAANAALCRDGAWRFGSMSLSTAGETACRFETVRPRDGGYDLTGTCLQEGASTPAKLRLTFAESAGAMLVEGPPFQPIGLIPCPQP